MSEKLLAGASKVYPKDRARKIAQMLNATRPKGADYIYKIELRLTGYVVVVQEW